jgi:2-polyprenyl-3-methyl-5-hydroxy-6-metoxy-1,4-benzoquinol methylase
MLRENSGNNLKILDAGCGVGRNYIALHKKGCEVYGIDINEE